MTLFPRHKRGIEYSIYDSISTPAGDGRELFKISLSLAAIRNGAPPPYIVDGHSVICARSSGFAGNSATDKTAIRPNHNRRIVAPISYTDFYQLKTNSRAQEEVVQKLLKIPKFPTNNKML